MTDKLLLRIIKPKAITLTLATNQKVIEVMRPPSIIPYNQNELPMSTLFQPSSLPNNVCYCNTIDHQYNLRLKPNLI